MSVHPNKATATGTHSGMLNESTSSEHPRTKRKGFHSYNQRLIYTIFFSIPNCLYSRRTACILCWFVSPTKILCYLLCRQNVHLQIPEEEMRTCASIILPCCSEMTHLTRKSHFQKLRVHTCVINKNNPT